MSAKVMGQVWDYVTTAPEQAVLLALADHADHNGEDAFPSVELIAWKTNLSERGVQGVLARLRDRGVLLEQRAPGYRRPRTYRIVLTALEAKATFVRKEKGARRSPLMGAPAAPLMGAADDVKGAAGDEEGAPEREKGAPTAAPEPSSEPSSDPSKNLSRATRAMALEIPTRPPTRREIAREQHRFGKLAEQAWSAAAKKTGCPYITRQHLRQVHELAIYATTWATEQQILAAIRDRVDAKSAPVRIPEWARRAEADDERLDHQRRLARMPDEIIEDRGRVGGVRPIGGAVNQIVAAVQP